MGLKETVRSAMTGRSAMVEKAIDKAVAGVGRASESLQLQAETLKERARRLDSERAATAGPGPATPPAVTEVATDGASDAAPGAGPPAEGPSLRGDLAPPPPSDPAAPTG